MTYFSVQSPYEVFTDLNGEPLENGYIWIGEANQNPITNQITVHWDNAGLYPIAQPIRTIAGYADRNGSPGNIYTNLGAFEDYSIIVKDKFLRTVYYSRSALSETIASGNTVDYIDDLRSISGYGQPIYVRWHSTQGDRGGGNNFEWLDGAAPGTYVDDDGITIVPTGGDGSGAWKRQYSGRISANWFNFNVNNSASDNYDILQGIIRNSGLPRKYLSIEPGTYQLDVFNPNNCDIEGLDVTFEFTYNAAKSVVMGQVTNSRIVGITFRSTETDLQNQRVTGDESEFIRCNFRSWLNPTHSQAWGLYFSGQSDCRVIKCGFADNTQSDLAIVDGADNIVVENCFAINPATDPLHINLEPNGSSFYNNVAVKGCYIGQLDLRENGTGGTSSQSVTISNCTIDELVYDGAYAVFDSCRIDDITAETIHYGGGLSMRNTIGLGPNLVPDPYFMANAFNLTQGQTNFQIWYMANRTGAITLGGRVNNDVNGYRYFSLNQAAQNGTISYRLVTALTVDITKTYCIAMTGRNISGTQADHLFIQDGGSTINTRSHRQTNLTNKEFVTEFFFVQPANTSLNVTVQNSTNYSTDGVDIAALTIHEVIYSGYNFDEMIAKYHDRTGPRHIVLANLPVTNPADQTGFQIGDMVTDTVKIWSWDGTTLQGLW